MRSPLRGVPSWRRQAASPPLVPAGASVIAPASFGAAPPASRPTSVHASIVGRLARNAGWILAGRGAAALLSLAYVAVAARTLGPHQFGVFSLILAYGGSIAALVACQTHNAVIRYGSIHLGERRPDRLATLLGWLVTVDVACALLGAVVAIAGSGFAAGRFGWSASERVSAVAFSIVLIFSAGSTASGICRLFGRFGSLAAAELAGPSIRLLGAAILWVQGGGIRAFLLVWALALVGEAAACWIAALANGRQAITMSLRSLGTLRVENRRILAFLTHNNLASSLSLVWQLGGVLIVGAYAGASAAGGFRLAGKLNGAVAKLAEAIMRALFPELARLVTSGDHATLRALLLRVTVSAAAVGACLVLVVAFAGAGILRLLYGHAFLYMAPLLFLMTIATAIELAGTAWRPTLNAHGASGRLLAAHCAAALAFVGASFLLVPRYGAAGGALATIGGMLVLRIVTGAATLRLLRGARE